MTTTLTHPAAAPTVLVPSTGTDDVLADALGRIITGRPLPESLRPVAEPTAAPATVQEGIEWILGGPSVWSPDR
jgi:hypothetical protein